MIRKRLFLYSFFTTLTHSGSLWLLYQTPGKTTGYLRSPSALAARMGDARAREPLYHNLCPDPPSEPRVSIRLEQRQRGGRAWQDISNES